MSFNCAYKVLLDIHTIHTYYLHTYYILQIDPYDIRCSYYVLNTQILHYLLTLHNLIVFHTDEGGGEAF